MLSVEGAEPQLLSEFAKSGSKSVRYKAPKRSNLNLAASLPKNPKPPLLETQTFYSYFSHVLFFLDFTF